MSSEFDPLVILIIGIGIGYFWAMYRKDNISMKITHTTLIDGDKFWKNAEEWRAKRDV